MKVDRLSAQYKIKYVTCNKIITSYNYEPNAKKAKNKALQSDRHKGHEVNVIE